jgi:hypothetical protein
MEVVRTMEAFSWTDLVTVLTFVLVSVQSARLGLGSVQNRLVDLLQDTCKAQADRITQLERELRLAREETEAVRKLAEEQVAQLSSEVADLRETVSRQSLLITRLEKKEEAA